MILPKKVLLHGCPRSGSTILQSILASHPDIISLPESLFPINCPPFCFSEETRDSAKIFNFEVK